MFNPIHVFMIYVEYETRRRLHPRQSKQLSLYKHLRKLTVARTRKDTNNLDKVDNRDHGIVAFAGTGGGWSTAIEIDGHASE